MKTDYIGSAVRGGIIRYASSAEVASSEASSAACDPDDAISTDRSNTDTTSDECAPSSRWSAIRGIHITHPVPSRFMCWTHWFDVEHRSVREALWRDRVEADPEASIHVHPHLVVDSAVSHVYSRTDASAPGRGPFALLARRTVAVPVLSPVVSPVKLAGHALVSSQMLGQEDVQECRRFVRAAHELLAQGRSSFLLFEDIDTKGTLWSALHEKVDGYSLRYPGKPEPHWQIEVPSRLETYWEKQFSGKTRSTLRRKAKRLDGKLVSFRTVEDIPCFLEAAGRVSSKSWQMMRLGRGVRGEACEVARLKALASLGALRSYVLERQGEPIAFVLGYQWKGRFVYESPGYDQAHADLSPGTVLLYLIIEDLLRNDPPKFIDFETGSHDYKEQFGNIEGTDRTVFLVKDGTLAACVLSFDHTRRQLRGEVRAKAKHLLQRAGVWQALRNRYKQHGVKRDEAPKPFRPSTPIRSGVDMTAEVRAGLRV